MEGCFSGQRWKLELAWGEDGGEAPVGLDTLYVGGVEVRWLPGHLHRYGRVDDLAEFT